MIEITDAPAENLCYDGESSRRIAEFLTTVPNGIQAMSKNMEGLVQTSLNLGQLNCSERELTATFSVRSSVGAEKKELLKKLEKTALAFGGTFDSRGDYPAWEYKEDSRLRETMIAVYTEKYGKAPVVEAIHAGLECGFFCDKIPGLDAGRKVVQIATSKDLIHWSKPEIVYKDGMPWGNHYNAIVPDDTVSQPNILTSNRFSLLNNHNGTDVMRYPVELRRKT